MEKYEQETFYFRQKTLFRDLQDTFDFEAEYFFADFKLNKIYNLQKIVNRKKLFVSP